MLSRNASSCLFAVIVVLGCSSSRALAEEHVRPGDLSGSWRLNHDLSDEPREKMRESRPGGGARGFGGGRRGGGLGGRRARPEGKEGEGFGTLVDPTTFETLTIVHRDPELRVTDGVGREHVFFTDGRKTEEERSFGGTTKIRAMWKDGHVVVTTTPEHGPKTTETYAVAADKSVLTVTTRVEARGRELEFRRVYDAMK